MGTPIVYDEENNKKLMVSARAGVYVATPDMELTKPPQIMDRVYPAIQIAKQNGLNVVFYDQALLERREHATNVRKQFAEAIAKREIVAYYQPKVDVKTGKVVGAEALCRWFRNGKMVMPMEFIPILEMNMDICDLDFYMFETVCRDIRRWLDEGREVPRVSVNFSRKHLSDPDLLGHILEIINRYELRRKYLEVELTETTSDVEFNNLNRIVTGLHREGIFTSVDDFGNGYSSLNLIRAIPWDVVKIDRSLLPMDGMNEDDITSRMYKHVVSMANDIGLECVTEGVETLKQVQLLQDNKCPIAQGFYFSKPLPVEEFEKLLGGTPFADKLS
jgi:EAL domain-containing protein (putative c-di-GMP-specific phosphodiesterase class I)